MTSRTLAKKITTFALEKKAHDVVLMDLRKIGGAADFFVICSADSNTHVKAVADSIREGTEGIGVNVWHVEGVHALLWVVLDYVDVVVHVFQKDIRSFYSLERLWSDARMNLVEDETGRPLPLKSSRRAQKESSGRRKLREVTSVEVR